MKDWIAGLLAVLGTLLILAGATVTVVKTLTPDPGATAVTTDPLGGTAVVAGSRFTRWLHRISAADRLIAWGVVLLVLAAVAAGAISLNLSAAAGTR